MRVPNPKANTTTEAYLAYKAGYLEESELKPILYEPYLHFDAWLSYWDGLTDTYPTDANGDPEMLCDEEALVAYLARVTDTYPETPKDPYDVRVAAYLRYLISEEYGRPDYPVTNEEFYLSNITLSVLITLTGIAPLTLLNALAGSLESLTAYGKCGYTDSELPSGYTRVGHITFGGSQFVNTGILPSGGLKIKVVFTGIGYNNTIIGGNTTSSNRFQVYSSTSTKSIFTRIFQSTSQASYTSLNFDIRHTLILDLPNSKISLDGNEKSISFTEQTSTSPIGLGATIDIDGTTPFAFLSSDVEQFTVWNNNILVANYIPCKNSSDVYGFYDTVSESFIGDDANVGFTGGGEIEPNPEQLADIVCNNGAIKVRNTSGLPLGYRRCDYIKSDDKIDLGIHTNQNTIVFCNYNRTGTSTPQYLYVSDSNSSGTTNTTAYVSGSNGNWRFDGKSQAISTPTGKHRSEQRKTGIWIDNSNKAVYSDVSNFTSTNTLSAFSSISSSGDLAIDRIQVRDYNGQSGVYDYDWVACQRYDGVYGFYDLKHDTFHTNPDATVTGGDITDSYEYYIDGTTETVTLTGKNKFDYEYFYDNYVMKSGSYIGRLAIKLKPLTQYTVSCNFDVDAQAQCYVWSGDDTQATVSTSNNGARPNAPRTVTTDGNGYLCVGVSVGGAYPISESDFINGTVWVQLEEGSTATTYEPYFNGGTATCENLLSVADYEDMQEVISGSVARAIGVKVLDGTEDWFDSTPTGVYGLGLSGTVRIDSRIAIPCTHYLPTNDTNSNMPDCSIKTSFSTVSGMSDKVCIFIRDDRFATVNDFKTYLAQQALAGTPVIVVYPLGTTTTGTVTGQPMTLQAGTNIVDITQASLDDLKLGVKYYGTPAS